MLQKIIQIQNIGQFKNFKAHGDIQFRDMNLIYGDNGRGKTTLTSIFRSLSLNNPNLIFERRSTSSSSIIFAEIAQDSCISKFKEETFWDNTLPEMEIFDSTFVNENVYSGNVVDHEHRKNLYHFVIGAEGVALAEEIELLDSQIKDKTKAISGTKVKIQEMVGWRGDIEFFINLENETDIDGKIKNTERQARSLEEVEKLNKKPLLTQFNLIQLPGQYKDLLSKSIKDISKDAVEKTKSHISLCMDDEGEKWILVGMRYLGGSENCPFCGQPHNFNELISAYEDYFSEAYSMYKKELSTLSNQLDNTFSQESLLKIQEIFEQNNSLKDDWSSHITLSQSNFQFDNFLDTWNKVKVKSQDLLIRKISQPLDNVFSSEELKDTLTGFDELINQLSGYNDWVTSENVKIKEFRKSLETDDLSSIHQRVSTLKAIKIRFSERVSQVCDYYNELISEKESLQNQKSEKQRELRNYSKNVFRKCVLTLNNYLEKFGCNFRINEIKPSFIGGTPSTIYELLLEDVAIPLGDIGTLDVPSFKTVLSDGDKNTLAFAFFLTKLDLDENLEQKVIIFDDPITSFGLFRKTSTQQEILSIARRAKQVIVFSNDQHFLKMIWDEARSAKTLHLPRRGEQSSIEEWDITSATQSDYFRNYDELVNFLENGEGEPRAVVRCIRLLIEFNLRFRYPGCFPPNEWLGDYIKKIEEASYGEPLESLKKDIEEISQINNYSKKFHHAQNPNFDSEPINATELTTYARRTLKWLSP